MTEKGKISVILRRMLRGSASLLVIAAMMLSALGSVYSLSNLPKDEMPVKNISLLGTQRMDYDAPGQQLFIDASPSTEELVIYVTDDEGDNIEGCIFQAVVTPAEGEAMLLIDDDRDGNITLEQPAPGLYTVSLLSYGDYEMPESIEVTVEEPVEHKKVDVSYKNQNDVDMKNDDSQYGGGSKGDDNSNNDDTVDYVEPGKEEIGKEIVEKPLTDADGNQLYGSVPKLSQQYSSGYRYLFDQNGDETWVRAVVDENGYLVKAEQKDVNDKYVECTYSVVDQYGYPICSSDGRPLYIFEDIVALTTTEEQPVYKYTGWQVIDGKTYYFDKNGNKVTGLQVINGLTYFFDENGVRATSMGIDVSTWNENINWSKVKAAGIDFVIVRCGFRGYGSGSLVQDDMFRSHMNGAINAGLKVGVYFFTQAISELEAVEEASMCLQMVQGYKLSYPIFIDMEDAGSSSARTNRLSNAQRTAIVNAFCDTIRSGGYTAGLYANKYYLESKINTSQISSKVCIWLAHYTSKTSYKGRYEMWQYSSTGSINGIPGNVDLNISYMGY